MQQFNKFSKSIIPSNYANRFLVNQLSFSCNFFCWFDSECKVQNTVCLANKILYVGAKTQKIHFCLVNSHSFLIKIHVRAA